MRRSRLMLAAVLGTLVTLAAVPVANAGEVCAVPLCSEITNSQSSRFAVRAFHSGCFRERFRHVAAYPCPKEYRGPWDTMILNPRHSTPWDQDWDLVRILRGYYAVIRVANVQPWVDDLNFRVTAHSGKDVYVRVANDETLIVRRHERIPAR